MENLGSIKWALLMQIMGKFGLTQCKELITTVICIHWSLPQSLYYHNVSKRLLSEPEQSHRIIKTT